MGRSEEQIAGVLGALGTRINHTFKELGYKDERPGIELVLEVERPDYTEGRHEWQYRMRDEFRHILEEKEYHWLTS